MIHTNRPFRVKHGKARNVGRIIAYDLETTNIPEPQSYAESVATPIPLYITAWDHRGLFVSESLGDSKKLAELLTKKFFVRQNDKARFVAWNANRFDLRIIINALVDFEETERFVIYPFVARNAGLRGAKVGAKGAPYSWNLYDGIAMTGLLKTSLDKFVKTYAPHVPKLKGTIRFDQGEEFDATNSTHVAYAERDSEALYEAMIAVEKLSLHTTGEPLRATVGRLGISYFQAQLPEGVEIWKSSTEQETLIRRYLFRGGYVYTAKSYHGPAWSYDINQAYAASMRDTHLPCGTMRHANGTYTPSSGLPGMFAGILSRVPRAVHPFLVKRYNPNGPGDGQAMQTYGEPMQTVLTTDEIRMLKKYGWIFEPSEGWVWDSYFSMRAMVDKLETLRFSDPDGPSGPIGTFAKALGNNAYGKTVEVLEPVKRAISRKEPPGKFWQLEHPEDESLHNFWLKILEHPESQARDYHRPQLGAFITAGVRCQVYEAIMTLPEFFLKADTDSVCFSRPNPYLMLDPRAYGKWKLEHDGAEHVIITKKVYAVREGDDVKIVCKGLSTRKLTWDTMMEWYETRNAPVQEQVQLQSWKKGVGSDAPMFAKMTRKGTQT